MYYSLDVRRAIPRRIHRARKTPEAFSAKLSNDTDLEALSEDLVGAVREMQLLSGYRAFLAASIQGRATSWFSDAHRLAPARGSSSLLIVYSKPFICSSVSSSASMNV